MKAVKKKNNNKIKERFGINSIYKGLIILLLVVYCASLLFVLFWLVYSSLKKVDEYILYPLKLPEVWCFENYKEFFEKFSVVQMTYKGKIRYGLGAMFSNSILWALLAPAVNVFWNTFTGYIIAKYRNKFTKFLYIFGVFVMVVPIVGSGAAARRLMYDIGMYDNLLMWVLRGPGVYFSGMHFMLMYSVFKEMPNSFSEAAEIDGASDLGVLFRIYAPLAFPSMMVLFILNFIGSWNDYGMFLYNLPSYPNIAYGMYMFQQLASSLQISTPVILAGFVVTSVPVIIFYFCSQNLIMKNFSIGGIKG